MEDGRLHPQFMVGLNAVIVAVTDESPRVLTVRGVEFSEHGADDAVALPFGPLDPERERTLERGVRGWVLEQTGLELGYVEQLYTFGDLHRHPADSAGGPRMISVAYLALVREGTLSGSSRAGWLDCYGFLPWEDWRRGRPKMIDSQIIPRLESWTASGAGRRLQSGRRDRVSIAFGLDGSAWDSEKVLERYELLYEAGLVGEALRDLDLECARAAEPLRGHLIAGSSMALDHRRMLATALGRLRGKIKYRPVVFELLPPQFTLLQLQRVVESLAGLQLHKQNFRRLVERGGLVEGTGQLERETGGRPAELFRFRKEVLRERRAPGVAIPAG